MSRLVYRSPWRLAALFLTSLLTVTGCSDKPAQQDNSQPIPVSTVQVKQQQVPLVFEMVGRTEGSKEVEIRARVSGILDKKVYSEGTTVRQGQVLFNIDPAPFEIALAHARASLAEQQATSLQAKRNSDRLSGLSQQNAVSKRVSDDALSAFESANAALLAAQANVNEAQLNLSYTKVTAPIAGIAGRSVRSEGSLVTAGGESSLLTTVTQSDPLWVRFAVSDGEYSALREAGGGAAQTDKKDSGNDSNAGARETLTVELLQKNGEPYPVRGQVNFAGSQIDTQLGTIQLRAEFPNAGLAILPGVFLRVRLSGGLQPAVIVPQTAVLQSPKGPYVWIVNDQQQSEQRIVQTGAWIGADWQITSGLADGDVVIVDNLLKLKQGQAVQLQNASAAVRSGTVTSPDADAG